MKLVSIVIVNHNGKSWLSECLSSIYKNTYSRIEVIVVDNASTDGSVKYIKNTFSQVKIIENKANLGFAEGNNIGVSSATGEYILLLNNDTVVEKHFLEKMVKIMDRNKKVGVVQGTILLLDRPDYYDSIGAFFTPTGFLYHFGYNQKQDSEYKREICLFTAKGACMLIRKTIIERLGLFQNEYFAYYEETDFCHKVWLSGYIVCYTPDSIVWHKMGATSNSMNQAFIQYHSFKNRIHSLCVNLGILEFLKVVPLHIILCVIIGVVYILKGKQSVGIGIFKAIYWNLYRINKTISERKIRQRHRKAKDESFLPYVSIIPPVFYFRSLLFDSLKSYQESLELKRRILIKAKLNLK